MNRQRIILFKILTLVIFSVFFNPQLALSQEAFSYQNSKGKTYYLFSKDVKLKNSEKARKIFYFTKDPNNKKGKPVLEVPEDKVVSETKNGLLVLKNKSK